MTERYATPGAAEAECALCLQTRVHDCPGGSLDRGYFTRRARLGGLPEPWFANGMTLLPGPVDAQAFPALPEIDP